MEYRIVQPVYTDKRTKEQRRSDTYHVAFRDHLNRRQSVAGTTRENVTRKIAERVGELVECRRNGEGPGGKLQRWVEALPPKLRERLEAMELIDRQAVHAGKPLLAHLDGTTDAEGKVTMPGFRQALLARGVTANHVDVTTKRVRTILDGCGLFFWPDLSAPGAATRVAVYLGERRTKGDIRGKTLNYYVRDFKGFCRWLAKQLGCPPPMTDLEGVDNAEVDSTARRSLSVEEMRLLLDTAAAAGAREGLTGEERALHYRFAFETGMRPGQMRALVVSDFKLDADPPTVTTHARHVKRRRTHTQVLRPALAADLRERFKTKLPTAAALKLPSKHHMAEMLRADLADARAGWIAEKGINDKEREQRQRSDFLAAVNDKGEVAVFYSTRHGHGTALADAGVPEKDIAASMHHASRTTTARYLHADRKAVKAAIDAMPDLSYSSSPRGVQREAQKATGTHGAEAMKDDGLRKACATPRTPTHSGAQEHGRGGAAENDGNTGESCNSSENDLESKRRLPGGTGRRDGFKIHYP